MPIPLSNCSDVATADEERVEIRRALSGNGYPRHMLFETNRNTAREEVEAERKVTLPYVQNVTDRIGRVLNDFDFKVFFRPPTRLSDILNVPKDRPPEDKKKGVVYKINCADCDKHYIGQTNNALITRIKQHEAAWRNLQIEKSAIASHAYEESHRIDWWNSQVIVQESRYRERLFLESWHIQASDNCVNRTEPIPACYEDVVRAWSSPQRQ